MRFFTNNSARNVARVADNQHAGYAISMPSTQKSPRLLHNQSNSSAVALATNDRHWRRASLRTSPDKRRKLLTWHAYLTQRQLRIGCQTPLTEVSFIAQKKFASCWHGPMQSLSLPILESPKSRRKHAIAAPTKYALKPSHIIRLCHQHVGSCSRAVASGWPTEHSPRSCCQALLLRPKSALFPPMEFLCAVNAFDVGSELVERLFAAKCC